MRAVVGRGMPGKRGTGSSTTCHSPRPAPTITRLPGFQEMLAYVTSGHGVAIVSAQTEQLYPRPGLTCIPIADGPTFDYAIVWRTGGLTALAPAFLHHAASGSGSS
ncbi:LysR substrate-binding domain-containing protein [Streptomyces smyrnaeus]|uniref:LysR substrate-binding domain-containing protein n=1 Tax=Streptomyces smyrnaeus TaxID=1387713 RepID=UPI0033B0FAD7